MKQPHAQENAAADVGRRRSVQVSRRGPAAGRGKPDVLGGGISSAEMDRVRRVHRLRSLRVASVLWMVVAFIMIGAAVVGTDQQMA